MGHDKTKLSFLVGNSVHAVLSCLCQRCERAVKCEHSQVCCCISHSASDQSPLTVVSSSSPEPTLEPHGGQDDITSFKTWVKFLPDSEAEAKQRLSPEIPVVCPTPVKGASSIVTNTNVLMLSKQLEIVLNYRCSLYLFYAVVAGMF